MVRVIGIGDNVVDKYLHLNTMFPGGNALNFSVYAEKLGGEAAYLGVLGDDRAGRHIISVLKELGVDTSHCRIFVGENGYAKVNLVDGDRVFVGGNKGGVAHTHPLILSEEDLSYIKDFDLVHSSCFSNLEDELVKIRRIGIPISFDFSTRIEDDYLKRVCPYLDFAFLSCSHLSPEETEEKLREVRGYGSSVVLATRGVEGAILLADDKLYYQKAEVVEPLDTLGAGDSFITAFLMHVVESGNQKSAVLNEALQKGAKFAARTCLVQGAFEYGKPIEE